MVKHCSNAGSYGLPQPWYFPLSKSYWRGHSARDDDWCCGSGPGSLSVMEEDQQAASAQRLTDQGLRHVQFLSTLHICC